jgi:hypothetical protein
MKRLNGPSLPIEAVRLRLDSGGPRPNTKAHRGPFTEPEAC